MPVLILMQSRGYLGPEQQNHHAVVDYTASRYLTNLWTNLSFNKHKNIKGSLTIFKVQIFSNIFITFYQDLTAEECRLKQAYRMHNTYVQSQDWFRTCLRKHAFLRS